MPLEIPDLHEIPNVISREGSHGSFSAGGPNWGGHHCHYVCTNRFVHAYQYHQLGHCYGRTKMLQCLV